MILSFPEIFLSTVSMVPLRNSGDSATGARNTPWAEKASPGWSIPTQVFPGLPEVSLKQGWPLAPSPLT